MGFLNNQIEKAKAKNLEEVSKFLLDSESVESVILLSIDFLVVTNKRLVFVDKSWNTTKKSIISIPYSKITHISVQQGGGLFSLSKEFEIYIGKESYEFKLMNQAEIIDLYKMIASKIC